MKLIPVERFTEFICESGDRVVEAGAKRILIPSENKRDVAEIPDSILTKIQWHFYDSPTRAVIRALGLQ